MQNDAYFKIAQDFWQRPLYLKCFLGSQPKRIFQSNLAKFVKSFAVYLLQLLNHNYHKKWLFSCIEHLLDSAVWWWLSVLYIVLLCSATVSAEPLLELLNMVASVIIHTDKTSSYDTSAFKWPISFPYSLLCNLHKRYHGESILLKVLFMHCQAFQGQDGNGSIHLKTAFCCM